MVVGGATATGALGAEAARAVSLELRVDAASHPYLADHRDRGEAGGAGGAGDRVVRCAAARAVRPDLAFASVRDLKVLRGISSSASTTAATASRALPAGRRRRRRAEIAVELRGRGDALHYSAAVEMPAPAAGGPADAGDAAARGPGRAADLYDGHAALPRPELPGDPSIDGRALARGRSPARSPGGAAIGLAGRRRGAPIRPLLDGGLQLARAVGPARARRRLPADGGARAAAIARASRRARCAAWCTRARPTRPRERRGLTDATVRRLAELLERDA